MSGQPDTSDDLIAELAKLMATNAKGDVTATPADKAAAPKPGTPEARPVVRIPGMDMPPLSVVPLDAPRPAGVAPITPRHYEHKPLASEARPAAPTVRIPGMDQPPLIPSASTPSPRPDAPRAPASVPPGSTLRPVSEFKPIAPTKPAEPRVSAEVRPLAPAASQPVRFEPRLVPDARPAEAKPVLRSDPLPNAVPVLPAPVAEEAPGAQSDGGLESRSAGHDGSTHQNSGGQNDSAEHKPAPAKPYDPIADIIAADLDDAERSPARPITKPVVVSAVATKPANVTPRLGPLSAPPAGLKLTPANPAPTPVPTRSAGFSTRQVPPESDTFFVAPVFGLGGKPNVPANHAPIAKAPTPAPASPPLTGDPMDEIESLIGEAVRVEMAGDRSPPVHHEPLPKPSLMPTVGSHGSAPRRAEIKQHNTEGPQSAEAAILAAAAATGAEVGRIEPVVGDSPIGRRKQFKAARPQRRSPVRQYVGLAVAGTLLLAAVFGLYWVLGMGRGDPATAPVLTADATPVKQVPAVVAANTEPRSPVFDQIEGVATPEAEEALVSRDQTDGEEVQSAVTATGDDSESPLATRKVRTVTVRPDGTIVASDDAVAGAEALPVERPNVPEVPGADVSPSDLLTATARAVTDDPITALIANTDAVAEQPTEVATAEPSPVLALSATVTPSTVIAPAPLPRPSSRENMNGSPSNSVTAEIDEPAPLATAIGGNGQQIDLLAQPKPEPAQVATAAPVTQTQNNAAAYVQLSSQRSEADARASAKDMQTRFGGMLSGKQLEIHRADLGAKGVYYRVWLPTGSRAEAIQVCEQLKASAGNDACYVP